MRTFLSRLMPSVGLKQGFVYVPEVEQGPMKNASAGATISTGTKQPPWIVVDISLDSIIPAKWPGKLWEVEIVEPAPEQPNSTARYTRAVTVRVLDEQPISQLFGSHGASVCQVLDKARQLEVLDVQALATSTSQTTRRAYSRAWSNWLAQVEPNSPHRGDDLSGTLAISGEKTRSPIGAGFSVLYSVFVKRARELVGDSAFLVDSEGEQSLVLEWANAFDALLAAAMAFGAPDAISPSDREALSSPWTRVFGEKND